MAQQTLRGVVRRIFASYPDRPWMAGVLAGERGAEERFSGKVIASAGDRVELTGEWRVDGKFGKQFVVESGIVKMDETPTGLAHLLSTHKDFKGIGAARAQKIVDAVLLCAPDGNIADALRDRAQEIASRANVPLDVVVNAAQVWNSKRSYFSALASLTGMGWSGSQAASIVNVLGDNAPAIVASDPYLLIGRVPRFGFKTVDAVAIKTGTPEHDRHRMIAGVAYCLDKIAESGSTWTTQESLIAAARSELRPNTLEAENAIVTALSELVTSGEVVVEALDDGTEIVAAKSIARIEVGVFERLLDGLRTPMPANSDLELGIRRAVKLAQTLNQGQMQALVSLVKHQYAVVSGGAGVGKTYTMRAVCEVALDSDVRFALCAPTGKAARKLSHATGHEAKTIHRLLATRYDEDTGSFVFSFNRDNRLPVDLVIVDEVSMVDVRLMSSLLDAMRDDARLLLVGDHHQIPSVGPGAILRDILDASRIESLPSVTVLREIVRQAGVLARNTTAILDGVVAPDRSPAWAVDFTQRGLEIETAAQVATLVEALVTAPLDAPLKPFGRPLSMEWDVQVLAPMRKGPLGVNSLNAFLQRVRQRLLGNPPPPFVEGEHAPKPLVADRVIWTVNDYELDLYNGTQAIVMAIHKDGSMDLRTEDGREITIPSSKRVHVEVAYAMTIHKAQGSEWPCVILVISSTHFIMRDRNLLYTGAGRASESLTIMGDKMGIGSFARERISVARQTFGQLIVRGWHPTSRSLVAAR